MILKNKNILITGASQGLGYAIAETCLQQGAHLFLCARDAIALQTAQKRLLASYSETSVIYTFTADVSSKESVDKMICNALKKLGSLDGLVNNAGIYGPIGLFDENDWDHWSQTIAVNLLGTALTCRAVLPQFRKQGHGKIVNLSGGGGTASQPHFSAYAASKAAVLRFTETLADEVRSDGIQVNAIAPGALNTRLLDQVLEAGAEKAGKSFYERSLQQKAKGGAPLQKGADLCAFLLSEKSDKITGKILSAIWDPWEKLPEHLKEIETSDVYTLRRIVPKDRGMTWGDS